LSTGKRGVQADSDPGRDRSGKDAHPSFGMLTGKVKVRCHCQSFLGQSNPT